MVNLLIRKKEMQPIRGVMLNKTFQICPEDPNRDYTVIIIGVSNTLRVSYTVFNKLATCHKWLFKFQ